MLALTEMELTYASYQARQQHEVTRAGLVARAHAIRPGGRFRRAGGLWRPEPYVGHAVVTMLNGNAANARLADVLAESQSRLARDFGRTDALYLLPRTSFHQTIANTLSAERHEELVVRRGLQEEFPRTVGAVLSAAAAGAGSEPVAMRMVGVAIFSTAIGVLGVFDDESDFDRVLAFRDYFYGHERIAQLGIRRTRPFIGHITLGYIEAPLDGDERRQLIDVIESINHTLASSDLRFHLPACELRAYEHLAEFRRLPDQPAALL